MWRIGQTNSVREKKRRKEERERENTKKGEIVLARQQILTVVSNP